MKNDRQPLTPKQLIVLQLSAQGYAGKEIAEKLQVSLKTVQMRKVAIFDKLKAKNMPHAVWIGVKRGLLT